jgi:hypothetical protein
MKILLSLAIAAKLNKFPGMDIAAKICLKPTRLGINLIDWLYERGFTRLVNLLVPLVAIMKLVSMPVYGFKTHEDINNFFKSRGWTREQEEDVVLAMDDEFPF